MIRPISPNRNHTKQIMAILNQLHRDWYRERVTSDVVVTRDWLKGVVFGIDQALRSVRGYRKEIKTRG